MCQSKRAVHFLTPNLMESTEQEKLVSPSQLQQQPQTSFVKTQRIFQSKPNIISPVLSISNIWDVLLQNALSRKLLPPQQQLSNQGLPNQFQ